jgi:type IV pilus assembly protein PilN
MRVDINLATQPYQDARQFWSRWGGGLAALGVLTIVLLSTLAHQWMQAREANLLIRRGEQQIAALDNQRVADEALLNRPENRSTRDRSDFLNDLFGRKAFSWTKVFEDLEEVMPPRLHVVSIKPEMTEDNQLQISLTVAGESRDRALDLLRQMENSQHFHSAQLKSETQGNGTGQAGDTVQIDLTAVYVPETEIASGRSKP